MTLKLTKTTALNLIPSQWDMRYNYLQCVTITFNVLQLPSMCYSYLQCVIVIFNVQHYLQCVTVTFNVLQLPSVCNNYLHCVTLNVHCVKVTFNALQLPSMRYSYLQDATVIFDILFHSFKFLFHEHRLSSIDICLQHTSFSASDSIYLPGTTLIFNIL